MKYNIYYFMNFFKKKKNWANGVLEDSHGNYCALGHMKFKDESHADYNVRAKSLANMIASHIEKNHDLYLDKVSRRPSSLIPTINDGHRLHGKDHTGKRKSLSTRDCFGIGPEKRVNTILKEIKKECKKNFERKVSA